MPRGEVAQVLHNLLDVLEGTPSPEDNATVTEVIDGDTIEAHYQGVIDSVRLIGFDALETGEPFWAEATAALRGLVEGKSVRLEFDVEERDQYGRLLAYVFIGARMVNAEMLRQGMATLYTVPPNVRYTDEFEAAQDEAQAAGWGIWGAATQSPLEIASIRADAAGNDNDNLNDEWIEFRVTVSGTLAG